MPKIKIRIHIQKSSSEIPKMNKRRVSTSQVAWKKEIDSQNVRCQVPSPQIP
jgi:hypothetical protein